MATAPRIRLNFLPLAAQEISGTLWRKPLPPTTAKPEHALCYTLPTNHDPEYRATYLISLTYQPDYTVWDFRADQNRQLALRYLFELLVATTRDRLRADTYTIHNGFQRAVAYSFRRTPLGDQEIWLEPYYLAATKQYGFLVDFHFNKPEQVPYSRDVQRLSLSLDEHYRSNKNSYIDREALINAFLQGYLTKLFPLEHATLATPIDLVRTLTTVSTEQLKPKVFVLGGGHTESSQWKGLEHHGPLEPVASTQIGFIMLYQRDDRPLAEDLYRGLMGKASGVAFKGLPAVFHLTIHQFHGVTLDAWTLGALRGAVTQIETIKRDHPGTTFIVLMVEDRENSAIYYEAKYQLLQRELPLQVVSAQLIKRRDQFKWAVSNIALQIFTKLGGKPWKVVPAHEHCLIIGIGQAHRLSAAGIQKYFAYCVATDSSGLYKKIVVLSNTNSRAAYLQDLTNSLIRELSATKLDEYTHCVIHIPFKLKNDELQALEDAVKTASQAEGNIKFTVLKINDRHRFFGYAANNSRIPIEGTIARLAHGSLLLWFEGLKTPNDVVSKRIAGPVHLEFLWPKDYQEPAEQHQHLQDLFNLSGTNWRGFNARSTPISTYYCRLIAKFLAEFPEQLPRIEATAYPWFL